MAHECMTDDNDVCGYTDVEERVMVSGCTLQTGGVFNEGATEYMAHRGRGNIQVHLPT